MRKVVESSREGWTRMMAVVLLSALGCFVCPAVDAQTTRQSSGRAAPSYLAQTTPEAQGMTSEVLAQGIEYFLLNRETYRIHNVVVIRNGHVVLNAGFSPFSSHWRHDLASVTKSLTSTLIGIAIDQGHINGVETPVLDFFPDLAIANLSPRKERMTLEHLLTMRSGFECDPTNSEATLTEMTNSPDWVQFALDLPMAEEPGERRVYCSPNVHLLSAIIERATGMSTLDFAQEHLFEPLGIIDLEWLIDPQGIHRGWGDLHLNPLDMSKLGALYLDEGQWGDRQIVSSWWIEEASTGAGQQVPGWPAGEGYSYLWYYAPGYYYASGRGGQLIFVFPDEKLVVGFNAGDGIGDYEPISTRFLETWVLGAIESDEPLAPNPEGFALLNAALTEAAASTEGRPEPVGALPDIAQDISGQKYLLEPNIYALDDVSLEFPGGDEAILRIGLPDLIGGPILELRIGLDNVNRFSQGRYDVMTAAKGGWVSDNSFTATIDEIGLINLWQWSLDFDGDTVVFSLESLAGGELPATITGTVAP